MTDVSRRSFLMASGAALSLALASCASSGQDASRQSASAASSDVDKHIIGVVVYDAGDEEVTMFRHYLVEYVAGVCFDDVQFVYSNTIADENDLLMFIDEVAEMGGEGVMSFFNIDLAAEVERCASHGMYHIVASGTVSEEDFAKVADNDHFIGCVGPGIQMEYAAGSNMVSHFVANKTGERYFIMSGGAAQGNEMHYQRVLGMLDMLETAYGVDLGLTKELAAVPEATTVVRDNLTVTISPGYVALDEPRKAVIDSFDPNAYDIVLSTIPVDPVIGMFSADRLRIAQVDCFSQNNQLLFMSGKLSYLVGKYGSIVGPSAAAMYNAVTGHFDEFRDNGKAFRIVQNFWTATSEADFEEKFSFASNVTMPAYNFEDLYSVCKELTPTATLDDLLKLASSSSYEDAAKRRSVV